MKQLRFYYFEKYDVQLIGIQQAAQVEWKTKAKYPCIKNQQWILGNIYVSGDYCAITSSLCGSNKTRR